MQDQRTIKTRNWLRWGNVGCACTSVFPWYLCRTGLRHLKETTPVSIQAQEPHEIFIFRFVRCFIFDVNADSISMPYLLATREVKIIVNTSLLGKREFFSKHRQVVHCVSLALCEIVFDVLRIYIRQTVPLVFLGIVFRADRLPDSSRRSFHCCFFYKIKSFAVFFNCKLSSSRMLVRRYGFATKASQGLL